jgi:hypothetical protein
MARLAPRTETLRALFARSGNECAFPGCSQRLINHRNQFVGQVCHINAAAIDGQRYDPNQTDDQRRSYENLILLCYPHHIETNEVAEYSAARLQQMKWRHEACFETRPYAIEESILRAISEEMNLFWAQVERLNSIEHSMAEFAVPIDARGSFFDVLSQMQREHRYLQSFFDAFREADQDGLKHWELHNLGVPNRMQQLHIDLLHLEIKFLEEYLKTHPEDSVARIRLEALKRQFKEIAQHAAVRD